MKKTTAEALQPDAFSVFKPSASTQQEETENHFRFFFFYFYYYCYFFLHLFLRKSKIWKKIYWFPIFTYHHPFLLSLNPTKCCPFIFCFCPRVRVSVPACASVSCILPKKEKETLIAKKTFLFYFNCNYFHSLISDRRGRQLSPFINR